MRRWSLMPVGILVALVVASIGSGQRFQPGGPLVDRFGVPEWTNDPAFPYDEFTFARIKYTSYGGRRGWQKWATDYPDADLNFSFRLQQLTSFKVNTNPVVVELTDSELFDYPFVYMAEPGDLYFSEEEVKSLRRYLLQGGFLMVDDFWGEREWYNFYTQIKRVFPDREPVELPLEHPIFNCVYELKEKPQIPSIGVAIRGRAAGITWERPDAKTPHYRAIHDDKGKIMVMICHNTDLADGWEEEGRDEWYFREFCEKKAYPLGINIVTYALTH
jgi:hypothetical protein